MPRGDFYAGLPLAEQLQKLVDHHHDPAVRHISQDEAAILEEAVERLRVGYPRRARVREFEAAWDRLEHRYETTIWSESTPFALFALTLPMRSDSIPPRADDLVPAAWVIADAEATTRSTQAALNVVFRCVIDPDTDMASLWSEFARRRSPPKDPELGAAENELLNRALYQPTIAVEESPPIFESLSEIVGRAAGPSWVALVASSGDPVAVVAAGGVVIVLSVSRTILKGAAEGLAEGLRERLYEWSRPKVATKITKAVGAAKSQKALGTGKPQKTVGAAKRRAKAATPRSRRA